jgi:transcription antitermination factor NusG
MLNGFETYLPILTSWHIWSDRKKKVEKPLISSVVFARTDTQNLRNIYPISGVAGILTYLGKPAIVQDFEINNLRILLQQDDISNLETKERFEQGETVEVMRGPFKGIIATALTEAGSFRLVVEIQSLGTGFTVNVPKSYVRKLKS